MSESHQRLAQSAIAQCLQQLNESLSPDQQWSIQASKLCKTTRHKNFQQAMAFMNAVAIEAERLNHHPEWRNVYNVVDIQLTTHEMGGISTRDFALANAIEYCLNNPSSNESIRR